MKMMHSRWLCWLTATALALAPLQHVSAEGDAPVKDTPAPAVNETPEPLRPWFANEYKQRYLLKVEAPGEAGGAGLHPDPQIASLVLPGKLLTVEGAIRPEPILLVGENGQIQPILSRPGPGGRDIEIAFRTRPGLRRYMLYAACEGNPTKVSPTDLEATALRVRMRGRSAGVDFRTQPATLDLLQQQNAAGDVLPVQNVGNIDNAENPYLAIPTDVFGHVREAEIVNPDRYTAVYEGFLRIPAGGNYEFSIDTPGSAHLLIDGQKICGADTADAKRKPFTIKNGVELSEGLHRLVLFFAETASDAGRTHMDQNLFGVRLHWKTPGAPGFMCIPAQAFPRAVPATVRGFETGPDGNGAGSHAFIHVENVGQVRTGSHRGPSAGTDYVRIFAKSVGAPNAQFVLNGKSFGSTLLEWVPAGQDLNLELKSGSDVIAKRTVRFPTLAEGARDVLDLEGELALKSAPNFIRPTENAYFHLETHLSPAPEIVTKERTEAHLVPPPARPLGEFEIVAPEKTVASTPLDGPRNKTLVEIDADDMATLAREGKPLEIGLSMAGIPVDGISFTVLDANTRSWPDVEEDLGKLVRKVNGVAQPVLVIVPEENEKDHRHFAAMRSLERISSSDKRVLFLGDPMVETTEPAAGKPAAADLPQTLAKLAGGYTWQSVAVPGPHRHAPLVKILASYEKFVKTLQKSEQMPGTVVLFLGGGDAARQAPLHSFERGLDALLDRLRANGVRRVLVCGAIPEPYREEQARRLQDKINEIVRQHHVDGVDILEAWVRQGGWQRYFTLTPNEPIYGPLPNAEGREALARIIAGLL